MRGKLTGAAFGALMAAGLLATPIQAAEGWGLPDEEIVRFEAMVVDVRCEITGECPANCGGGDRQLGLLTDEGKLFLAFKNFIAFAGAAAELIDFCGKRVVGDGLIAHNYGVPVFALQFVKEAPDGKWRKANRYQGKWAAANGVGAKSEAARRWFRNDSRIEALIGRDGKLGLGPGVLPAE